jgi:hypothetical protein
MRRYYTVHMNKDLKWGKMKDKDIILKAKIADYDAIITQDSDYVDTLQPLIMAANLNSVQILYFNVPNGQHKWSNSTAYRSVQ